MKIAQIAPLFESVPPRLYGGTERIVSFLTEELVQRGHEVTLFASGDSVTSAELVPCSVRGLRLDAYAHAASAAEDRPTWTRVLEKLRAQEMPPAKAKQPKPATPTGRLTSTKSGR